MGQRTSVYLTADLEERVKASGAGLAELIKRGLDAAPLEQSLRQAVRAELDAGPPPWYDGKPATREDAGQAADGSASPAAVRNIVREELDDALLGEVFETRLGRVVREQVARVAGETHA
jgi:hypothetical protein